MFCFRDSTFCKFYKDCKDGKECRRALTEEIKEAADRWWGKGGGQAPICSFSEKPECHKETDAKE